MELAIISDTHMPRGGRSLPARCLELCREADRILHVGDLVDLSVLQLLQSLGPPVHAISGNADNPALCAVVPERLELELEGVRLGMTHIPGAAAGRLARLRAAFPACQAVVFGHTHMPEHAEHEGFQIFNPGSPTERRRAALHTMGVARISGGHISFELINV
jgi:putative phosphoesterase